MWNPFKKKSKVILPLNKYRIQFKVSYQLSDGNERSTGMINITVPATSAKQAVDKLENFAVKRISVKIINLF